MDTSSGPSERTASTTRPTSVPADVIASELGVEGLWPLPIERFTDDQELFFDVVEVLHDLVAAPRSRWVHSYAGCGLPLRRLLRLLGSRRLPMVR